MMHRTKIAVNSKTLSGLLFFLLLTTQFFGMQTEAKAFDDKTGTDGNQCVIEVVSDTTDVLSSGGSAVATYNEHPFWTASIPGATWIWRTFFVEDPTQDEYVNFSKDFNITSVNEIDSASLVVAADNSYKVYLNSTQIGSDDEEANYYDQNKDSYDVVSGLVNGNNTLSFEVKNWALSASTPESNPAGLLYKLTINAHGSNCGEIPSPKPTVSLSANPASILKGATSTLSWNSLDAESCSAPWTQATSTSGSQEVSPLSSSDYSISCTGSGGSASATTTITVTEDNGGGGGGGNPTPTVSLTANPISIMEGATSTLSWTSNNVSVCVAGWTSQTSTSGTQEVSLASTTSYSIECGGAYGSTTATVTITVTPAGNGGPSCTLEIFSDDKTLLSGGAPSVATYSNNPNWTASIPGATWIWRTFFVEDPTQDETNTFIRVFEVNHEIKEASLIVAADNSYSFFINEQFVAEDQTELNYRENGKDFYDIGQYLNQGTNEIKFIVRNWPISGSVSESNPAGLLYKISIIQDSEDCGGGGGGVTPTPSVTLTADPSTINSGAKSVLMWNSSNTSFCSASWTMATSTSGSQEVSPASTSEYSISCGGAYGTTTASATITVNTDNGGGGGGSTSGGGGGGGGIGGRRRDISNLLAPQGEVLGAASCSYLRDYLRRDWMNDPVEVLKLQSFLNVFEGEKLSYTASFDEPTFQAVSRFQNKYFYDILEPWGHEAPTGFVYILTKKKINEIYCNTLISLTSDQQQEILSFRSFLKSLRPLSDGGDTSSFGGDSGAVNTETQIISSQNVLDREESGIVVVSLNGDSPEKESTSVVKNAAVSLFGASSILNNKNYLIVLAVLLVVFGLGLLARKLLSETDEEESVTENLKEPLPILKSEDSPVIVLPGATSQDFEDELPDEEIVIEENEEGN